MIILIRKRLFAFCGLFCCFFVGVAALLFAGHVEELPVFSVRTDVPVTVVIDPGHGGEDGGAVSSDGVEESKLNLGISLRLDDLLRFAGVRTMMTRREDIAICDEGLETIRARKASDIRNRVDLVNQTENAVLLSIHQNSLPSSPVTHGAQVFWNQAEGSEELAKVMQDTLNEGINTEKAKQSKKISDTIYLMRHVTAPAVLVECGFLSNTEETVKLQEPSYQKTLAAVIAAGFLRAMTGEGAA